MLNITEPVPSHSSEPFDSTGTDASNTMIRVECVFGLGYRSVECIEVHLVAGSRAYEALREAFKGGLTLKLQEGVLDAQSFKPKEEGYSRLQDLLSKSELFLSNWGEPCSLEHVLMQSTRLEITKPLRVDPKVARRERFKKQGAKAAGLFAKQRAGGKSGY
jgi:putative ubiquitin-RnfH superfamily antitoxin RatB of RatAB toxin-antitoxin module